MQVIVIVLLIIAVLLVIFTLQNSSDITLNVLFWEIHNVPLVIVLLSCIILGYLISTFYFYPRLWKLKRNYKKMVKLNNELNEKQELYDTEQQKEKIHPEGVELDTPNDLSNSPFFND